MVPLRPFAAQAKVDEFAASAAGATNGLHLGQLGSQTRERFSPASLR